MTSCPKCKRKVHAIVYENGKAVAVFCTHCGMEWPIEEADE